MKQARIIALGIALVFAPLAQAQAPAKPAASPIYKNTHKGEQGGSWASIAKLPDFGGIWAGVRATNLAAGEALPVMTPKGAAMLKDYQDAQKRGERLQNQSANCIPPSPPRIMAQPYPQEFLVTPGKVTVAIETYSQMRRVFTDGRPHPEDPDPTYMGHSIGYWDGDTLVVDTIGLVDTAEIVSGLGNGKNHLVERIRLTGPDAMEIETTITNPDLLAAPLVQKRLYRRHRDWTLMEYVCQQNNKDGADPFGRPSMDLNKAYKP